jgi:hypothetical protein
MHQTTLTGDDRDDEPAETPTTERESTTEHESSSSGNRMNLAPPDQRGSEGCCPWCLANPETFEQHGDERPRCGFCDAAIPVGADWFERGEKIIL